MYKLLIVDDEAFIADGLAPFTFSNFSELPLDVCRMLPGQLRPDAPGSVPHGHCHHGVYNMPGLSGLDMLKEIQKRSPGCRTIVLSGYSEFDYAQTALRYGADYYILKSEGDEALIDAVKGCIQKIESAMKELRWKDEMEKALEKAAPLLRQNFPATASQRGCLPKELTAQNFQQLMLPLSWNHRSIWRLPAWIPWTKILGFTGHLLLHRHRQYFPSYHSRTPYKRPVCSGKHPLYDMAYSAQKPTKQPGPDDKLHQWRSGKRTELLPLRSENLCLIFTGACTGHF